jgi:hypothetical protein
MDSRLRQWPFWQESGVARPFLSSVENTGCYLIQPQTLADDILYSHFLKN